MLKRLYEQCAGQTANVARAFRKKEWQSTGCVTALDEDWKDKMSDVVRAFEMTARSSQKRMEVAPKVHVVP